MTAPALADRRSEAHVSHTTITPAGRLRRRNSGQITSPRTWSSRAGRPAAGHPGQHDRRRLHARRDHDRLRRSRRGFRPGCCGPAWPALSTSACSCAIVACWLAAVVLLAWASRPVLNRVSQLRWVTGAPLDPRPRWVTLPPVGAEPGGLDLEPRVPAARGGAPGQVPDAASRTRGPTSPAAASWSGPRFVILGL